MRQLVYTIYTTTNNYSFSLCWKEYLVKHQKGSKYYDQVCFKFFVLHLISLLKAPILENSQFLVEISFIFLKKRRKWTSKAFNTKFTPRWKGRKSSYQVKKLWSLLCKFFTQILDSNYIAGLRYTKIVKQTKFQGLWGELEAQYCFQRHSWLKHIRKTLVLELNSALREKLNFIFWTVLRMY